MSHTITIPLVLVLFVGMLVLLEAGRRIGRHRRATDLEGASAGLGVVDGAVFSLLGLLIAFTFSGAASRFDARRELVAQEANAIGTAYLRLDLLPPAARQPLQDLFRKYLDARLSVYRALPDLTAAKAELARANALQGQIWSAAVTACNATGTSPAPMLLLPALNEMIDITTTRAVAAQIHPPGVIYVMLVVLALGGALLAGYGMAGGKTRSVLHMLAFASLTVVAVYVILDIEYPRLGLIRVDAVDQVLVDLRESMK
jgi:hypothetical protein